MDEVRCRTAETHAAVRLFYPGNTPRSRSAIRVPGGPMGARRQTRLPVRRPLPAAVFY